MAYSFQGLRFFMSIYRAGSDVLVCARFLEIFCSSFQADLKRLLLGNLACGDEFTNLELIADCPP